MSHVILLPLTQQYARECAHNLFTCRVKNPIIAQLLIMNMQDATILWYTHLTISWYQQTASYFQLLALHIPTTSGRGQPHNTSYIYSPITQVANNIIPRASNSTLYQQTSWHLQHIVKIKYHTIYITIISFHAHAHVHVHVSPTNMFPPINQQNQTELIHSIFQLLHSTYHIVADNASHSYLTGQEKALSTKNT